MELEGKQKEMLKRLKTPDLGVLACCSTLAYIMYYIISIYIGIHT